MSEIYKPSVGNVIAPKSASILFGTEADEARTGLAIEDSTDTWNDYTIIADNDADMNSEEMLSWLGSKKVETLTLAEYEALTTKNPDVVYCITDDNYEGNDSASSGDGLSESDVNTLISAHNNDSDAHNGLKLPNPNSLTINIDGVEVEYDGSSTKGLNYISPTVQIPPSLKNPYALTFTGASTETYDGSKAVTVNIPTASSESGDGIGIDLGVTSASSGQVLAVSTIDDNNVPTAWKTVAANNHAHSIAQVGNAKLYPTTYLTTNPITPGTTALTSGSLLILYEV